MIQVVVPSYNCGDWIGRCLDSIVAQDSIDFSVMAIDDASPDVAHWNILNQTAAAYRFDAWTNSINMGAAYNIYTAVNKDKVAPDDIIVIVDGDDFLPHDGVLSRIAEIYEDPDVWLMWSQYEPFPYYTTIIEEPGGPRVPVRVDPTTTSQTQQQSARYTEDEMGSPGFFRSNIAKYNHIITFRAFLFTESIGVEDLTLADGSWPKAGYDRAIMTPMLERSGYVHTFHLPEVLYYYNSMNPQSDVSVRLPDAQAAHARILSLPTKALLSEERVKEIRAAG